MGHTIKEVSRLAGVSTATVSRTFSSPELVQEGTRKKIMEVAQVLNYQPNAIARSMALQQTERIAFIICTKGSSILSEFYANICEGIMKKTNRSDYQLLISIAEDWEVVKNKQIDGVILGGDASAGLITELQRNNVKIVLVNHEVPGHDIPCVVADEEKGVFLAVNHLLSKGHRDIAMLAGRFSPYISEHRYTAFQKAMKQLGLPIPESYVRMVDPTIENATKGALELLGARNRPSAVFAGNDIIAAAVLKAALRLHLRVPEDIAVVGYDDSRICQVVEPELTSVHIPCHRMGEAATDILFSLLKGDDAVAKKTVVSAELTIRHSV
ncbi:MAG: LacI family DNA-binding transcriptional regulator [Sphaerochaetaceae bacterium]